MVESTHMKDFHSHPLGLLGQSKYDCFTTVLHSKLALASVHRGDDSPSTGQWGFKNKLVPPSPPPPPLKSPGVKRYAFLYRRRGAK
jgi:hypothetical protein